MLCIRILQNATRLFRPPFVCSRYSSAPCLRRLRSIAIQQGAFAQVYLLSKHIGKEKEEIEKTITRPRYFDPYEAVEYGIIDRVRPFLKPAVNLGA